MAKDIMERAMEARKQLIHNKPTPSTTYIEAACAVILVLITGTYTYYARQQAKAAIVSTEVATHQAETAQNEFISSQRAWIAFEIESVRRRPGTQIVDVGYQVRNVGHSIASNLFFGPHFISSSRETGHECERPEAFKKQYEMGDGGIVMFPGDGFRTIQMSYIFPDDLTPVANVPSGPKMIGCAAYRTTVDSSTHYTRVPYFIDDHSALEVGSKIEKIEFHRDVNGTHAD